MLNKSKTGKQRKANNQQETFGAGFKAYDPDVFDLIALHFWTDRRRQPKGITVQLGKAPINARWSTMTVNSRRTRARCLEEGRNMGVRLKLDQLVIDADPRNYSSGQSDSFLKLCFEYGLNANEWPRVLTGSGGFHCYLGLPEGSLVRETLKDFPGIEFKSIGRQVVAAGSRHPNGEFYRWSPDYPSIRAALPMVPRALLQAIRRPIYTPREGGDGGVYDADQLALMLSALDVEAFRDHEDWLQLMFACHHATAGAGEEVFVRWSTSDPDYDDHDEVIAARWRSCGSSKRHAITYRTLNMILRRHGARHLVPIPDDEFPDVAPSRRLGKVKAPRVIGKVKP
jgi:hypothetical protein